VDVQLKYGFSLSLSMRVSRVTVAIWTSHASGIDRSSTLTLRMAANVFYVGAKTGG
jgi:hypothetical protein